MLKITLVIFCTTVMVIHGYSISKPKSSLDKLKDLIEAFEAKEREKAEQVDQPAEGEGTVVQQECPTGTVHKCVDAQSEPETSTHDLLEARLIDIEDQLDEITRYLSKEKETDKVLKQISEKVITEMKGKVQETDKVIVKLKNSVSNSLEDFEDMIREVNKSAQVTINSDGVIFYGRIGSPCTKLGNDCLDQNSECRSGKCQCEAGFSFDMGLRACVEQCQSYGTNYQSVSHLIIRGYNNLTLENVEGIEECKLKCNEETTFLCKTIDYFPRWAQCFLSEYTVLDVPEEACEYSSVGAHFQRDCDF